MSQAVYTCDALRGTGKKGILVPDADGYYDVILGAFDYFNKRKIYYEFNAVKEIFEASSDLMRRIKNGMLHGECGHPRRRPGESAAEFMHRCLDIVESNISHHIREVTIDRNLLKTDSGQPIVAVRGWVRPAGPHAAALKDAFGNGPENVCFSVRSFADEKNRPGMGVIRLIRMLVTWDWVMEGGIDVATKYKHPAMESMMSDMYFTESMVEEVSRIERNIGKHAFESGAVAAEQLVKSMFKTTATGSLILPGSARW